MKILFILLNALALALAAACSGSVGPQTAKAPAVRTDRGNEIVNEYLRREAAPFRKDRTRITVRSEDGSVEVYELDVWRRQTEDQTDTMSVIVKPTEDAGTATLSVQVKDKPTVNITYSQALDEFRESDTSKMFFGGLTAQELLGEWGKYSFTYLGDREFEGKVAHEVEGKLKDGQTSVIASNKVLFDVENFLVRELRLFDNTGKELRVYTQKETRVVDGRTYISKTDVVNHVYKSNITIEVLGREYPSTLDDALFSRERLRRSVRK